MLDIYIPENYKTYTMVLPKKEFVSNMYCCIGSHNVVLLKTLNDSVLVVRDGTRYDAALSREITIHVDNNNESLPLELCVLEPRQSISDKNACTIICILPEDESIEDVLMIPDIYTTHGIKYRYTFKHENNIE